MNQTASLAEMVNSTNFAVMNYQELTELNFAITWASGVIKPLMKTKRAEEMAFYTKAYVDTMNGYCATRSEIMDCLNNEDMKETSIFSPESNVDVQTSPIVPTEDKDNHQEKKEILLLPEHISDDPYTTEVISSQDESVPAEPQTTESTKKSSLTDAKKKNLLAEALEKAKTLPIPISIDTNAPYFVSHTFLVGEDGKLGGHSKTGWNMDTASIQEYVGAVKKYATAYLNVKEIESGNDYVVYLTTDEKEICVRMSYIPSEPTPTTTSSDDHLSFEQLKRMEKNKKKRISSMKKAIDEVKKYSLVIGGDMETPSFTRFSASCSYSSVRDVKEYPRVYGDKKTIEEMKTSIARYAKYCYHGDVEILETEDAFAVWRYTNSNGWMDVVLINIPSKETENNNVKKVSSSKDKKVSKKKTGVKKSAVKVKKEKKTSKTPSIKGTKKDPRCQSITLTNIETGEKRTWDSFRACDRDLGASFGTTSQVAKGEMKQVKGWKLCEGEE